MQNDKQRATLSDVLNYDPEQYLNESEVALIRSTFKDNPQLLAVIRKVMLPTISDPHLPIEEMASDALMANLDFAALPEKEIKSIVLARQDALKFIVGGLVKLKVFAASTDETPYQKALRRKKDSSK